MRYQVAPVKNITRLGTAYGALAGRDAGVPGIGLVHGFTGAGKTTAVAQLVVRHNGVHLRAMAAWTTSALLGALCGELNGVPRGRNAVMIDFILEKLAEEPRPLFIDEGDYLLKDVAMLETLRDIHDMSGVPLVIIGMDDIHKKITARRQFSRRITQWCEFNRLDAEDTATVARTVCEVEVKPKLLDKLRAATGGSVGLITVGLSRIEQYARSRELDSIDADQWGNRPFFMGRGPSAK